MGEEQKKKTKVERMADALPVWGFRLLVAFCVLGFLVAIYIDGTEGGAGMGRVIRLPLTICGFGFLAWLYCQAARYILVDVTSGMRKEKPNIVGRTGQVIYWLGCVVGILSMPVGVVICLIELIEAGQNRYNPVDPLQVLLVCLASLAIGAAAWLVGRAARYILKGD